LLTSCAVLQVLDRAAPVEEDRVGEEEEGRVGEEAEGVGNRHLMRRAQTCQ